jgi:PTH1 family peptidyl-tRNA hydrolase
MHLVVGLGNPGPKYARNRHNVGFMVVERLAAELDPSARFGERGDARHIEVRLASGAPLVLLEPLTFMNRSGEAVLAAMERHAVPLERVLVVHDELDLAFGALRLKQGGGVAGHRGLRSIVERCGGPEFLRLRVGIGRPVPSETGEAVAVVDWVLGDFDAAASAALPDVLQAAARAVVAVVEHGIGPAMQSLHAPPRPREG